MVTLRSYGSGGFLYSDLNITKNLGAPMKYSKLTPDALERALNLRDLADPTQGTHAMQQIIEVIHEALAEHWQCKRLLYRANPIVSIQDNYDRLGYPADGAARDARYTRYVTTTMMLRSHASAMIPGLLRTLAIDPPDDVLLICPGLVYRRDTIDRLHSGEPHHLDLWRVTNRKIVTEDLVNMISTVVKASLPGYEHRTIAAKHPYTTDGLQIDVYDGNQWIEIGECGLASSYVLHSAGLKNATGLAMGLGLDRILMIRKGINDIRLLRSQDPRVYQQMLDLNRYTAVSNQPAINRDLSVAIEDDMTAEELGDQVRQAIPDHSIKLESIEILSETPYDQLPPVAHARMGMQKGQKNVLLRLVIRDPITTLTNTEANHIRNLVYRTLHKGERMEWSES